MNEHDPSHINSVDSSEDSPTLYCLSPSYRDIPSFLRIIDEITETHKRDACLQRFKRLHFVVVDDSAGDDLELDDVRNLPHVTVLTPPFNLGHQRAIVFGLRILSKEVLDSDVIVTLDADGEDRPRDIPKLIEGVLAPDAGKGRVVLALRTERRTSLTFRVMYFCFQILFRVLTGFVVRTGNFACYSGVVLRRIILHPAFDQCYSSTLLAVPMQRTFVACPRGARYLGTSRMNTTSLVLHGYRMIMPFMDRVAIRTLFLVASCFGCAGVAGVFEMARRLLSNTSHWVNLTQVALFFLAAGIGGFFFFVLLFATYSQSQAISLRDLEEKYARNREE